MINKTILTEWLQTLATHLTTNQTDTGTHIWKHMVLKAVWKVTSWWVQKEIAKHLQDNDMSRKSLLSSDTASAV
jgi:hypothetical protein